MINQPQNCLSLSLDSIRPQDIEILVSGAPLLPSSQFSILKDDKSLRIALNPLENLPSHSLAHFFDGESEFTPQITVIAKQGQELTKLFEATLSFAHCSELLQIDESTLPEIVKAPRTMPLPKKSAFL